MREDRISAIIKRIEERDRITNEEARILAEAGFKFYIWEDIGINFFNSGNFTVIPDDKEVEAVDFEKFTVIHISKPDKEIHFV